MIQIGIIGYGYWGPNLVRNFYHTAGCVVTAVADGRTQRLEIAQKQYPTLQTYTDAQALIQATNIDAVVIATPVDTHYPLAKAALMAGKHVLLEKPMASSTAQAEELLNLAKQKSLSLMVDHTFLYTGAVKKIKALVDDGTLGTLQYLDSTRINLGLFQHDVNVLWDLAPHDLSILLHIYNEKPHSVKATGAAHTTSGLENIAYLTVSYKSGFIAHFSCSWVSPVKIRQMLVGGSNKMIVYNDMEPSEKIKIYDTGYQVRNDEDKHRLLIDYRTGDIYVPKLENTEALSAMARDFAASIADKKTPVSTAELGLEVVRLLEASDASLRAGGAEVLV